MGMMFNPMQVMMGGPNKAGAAYIPRIPPKQTSPIQPGKETPQGQSTPQPTTATVKPEAIRATGSGPFDAAFRQNLATFAGGLFNRPGGNLSFNPTSNQAFGGAPTGGGNDPAIGMPSTLLQNALGGNPFSFSPPQPTQPPSTANQQAPDLLQVQDWWNRMMGQGMNQRMSAQ